MGPNLRVNYTGCAICDSTWGDLWEKVEGERLFFCCDVCLVQFRQLVERVKAETGWDHIDTLDIAGDRRGRTCRAVCNGVAYRCSFAFNAEGSIREFAKVGDRAA